MIMEMSQYKKTAISIKTQVPNKSMLLPLSPSLSPTGGSLYTLNNHFNSVDQAGRMSKFDIPDGVNYRVIQGKHTNSRLVVKDNYCYHIGKQEVSRSTGEVVIYLKCKYGSCLATAKIRNNFLEVSSQDRVDHTCVANEGASAAKITAGELLTRMKTRAANEGTNFSVSIFTI